MSEKKSTVSYSQNEDRLIDIHSLMSDVTKEWLSIVLLAASAVLLSYVLLTKFHPLNYATTATMVVNNVNEDESAKTSSGTDIYENLNYGADSASRLKNILGSNALKNAVAKELGLKEFEGSTSAKTVGESNLLEITVRAKSPLISYMEAKSILKNYTFFSGDLVGGTVITVLEHPTVQESPEHPLDNIKYSFLFGGVVFIIVCFVLILRSSMRDTIHNSSEIESKVDAKLLATIMHETKHRKGKRRIGGNKASILITDPITSFQYAEDMRKLAARIMNEMSEKKQKVLLISSAMENEGKSTVSVNIALAMSQINKRIVLVDMDFRKPSMYKILNMQKVEFEELAEFIDKNHTQSEAGYEEALRRLMCKVPGTNLTVILNRKAVPQAIEKNSEFIGKLINELRTQADFIIIDTAPVGLVSDAEELSGISDTSVVVIREHWIEAREINDTIDALGGREHMLGCVLNNAHKSSFGGASVGYGYGYGYGGQYAK